MVTAYQRLYRKAAKGEVEATANMGVGGRGESHKQLNMTKSLGEQKENYLTVKLSNAALKIT